MIKKLNSLFWHFSSLNIATPFLDGGNFWLKFSNFEYCQTIKCILESMFLIWQIDENHSYNAQTTMLAVLNTRDGHALFWQSGFWPIILNIRIQPSKECVYSIGMFLPNILIKTILEVPRQVCTAYVHELWQPSQCFFIYGNYYTVKYNNHE